MSGPRNKEFSLQLFWPRLAHEDQILGFNILRLWLDRRSDQAASLMIQCTGLREWGKFGMAERTPLYIPWWSNDDWWHSCSICILFPWKRAREHGEQCRDCARSARHWRPGQCHPLSLQEGHRPVRLQATLRPPAWRMMSAACGSPKECSWMKRQLHRLGKVTKGCYTSRYL